MTSYLLQGGLCSLFILIMSLSMWSLIFERLLFFRQLKEPQFKLSEMDQREFSKTNRTIDWIVVLTITAPLLGLLGTVSGLITSFNVMNTGSGQSRDFTGGISLALITTQAGLFVSIPGYIMQEKIRKKLRWMEHHGGLSLKPLVGKAQA